LRAVQYRSCCPDVHAVMGHCGPGQSNGVGGAVLFVRWETVVVAAALIVLATYVVGQLVVRVNAARGLEALMLALRNVPTELNLYEFLVARGLSSRRDGGSPVDAERAHPVRAPRGPSGQSHAPRWSRRARTAPVSSRSHIS